MYLVKRSFLVFAVLVQSLWANGIEAKDLENCKPETNQECTEILANYPLFDTDYKKAANYVPVLALRAIYDAKIYREKRKAKIIRNFYIKDLSGKFSKPYQKMEINLEVNAKGLLGREIIAMGKINEFDFDYYNRIKFSLSKKARMDIKAHIDNVEFLDLHIESDGNKKTNDVKGQFLGKTVNYLTEWRSTSGTLAGLPYTMFVKGTPEDEKVFSATSKGFIGTSEITGEVKIVDKDHYLSEENYGPILIKTDIVVFD